MKVDNICSKCGEVNTLESDLLFRKHVYDEEGKHYIIIYYVCKRCNEINVVQIDDNETAEIYKKLKNLIVSVMKKQIKKQTVSPREQAKKDKLMKKLRQKREELKELSAGKKYFDENKEIFIECLTFPKVGDIIDSDM